MQGLGTVDTPHNLNLIINRFNINKNRDIVKHNVKTCLTFIIGVSHVTCQAPTCFIDAKHHQMQLEMVNNSM